MRVLLDRRNSTDLRLHRAGRQRAQRFGTGHQQGFRFTLCCWLCRNQWWALVLVLRTSYSYRTRTTSTSTNYEELGRTGTSTSTKYERSGRASTSTSTKYEVIFSLDFRTFLAGILTKFWSKLAWKWSNFIKNFQNWPRFLPTGIYLR